MGKQIATPRLKTLLDQVRDALRLKHYPIHTEEAHANWIKRYILPHNKCHPLDMGVAEIEIFLTHLAVEKNVAASTQNQALGALLFLCRTVLHKDLDGSIDAVRAKKPPRLPPVLTKGEVRQVLRKMSGLHQLMTQLLYCSRLRLVECWQKAPVVRCGHARRCRDAAPSEWRCGASPGAVASPSTPTYRLIRGNP